MRFSTIIAATAAGVLLVAICTDGALGGWFGLGGSDKSADTSKASKTAGYSPSKSATGSSSSSSSGKGLFGTTGGSSSSKPESKKKVNLYSVKPGQQDKSKNSSWWSSWMKPKEQPKPKTTSDWMKLKQVQY